MKLKPIREQVVVVFGASSGIGRETAKQFARKGAKVVVSARSEDGLETLVDEIRRYGGDAISVPADVAKFDEVKEVAERAAHQYGRLDTWVHCAAVSLYATFEQTTPEEFARVIDVNLVGAARGLMAALPLVRREGRGALIVISSVEGKRALPLQSAYASSKHGIEGLLDAVRAELQNEGASISVTSIKPAGINTPFFNKARTKLGVKPQPSPPIYEPEIVAETILYAAEHPVREMLAGGAAKALVSGQAMAPGLMDKVVATIGVDSQKSTEPKSEDAPDNLYGPIRGYSRVHGDFSDKAKDVSVYTWLQRQPGLKAAVVTSALGALAWWAFRPGREPSASSNSTEENVQDGAMI